MIRGVGCRHLTRRTSLSPLKFPEPCAGSKIIVDIGRLFSLDEIAANERVDSSSVHKKQPIIRRSWPVPQDTEKSSACAGVRNDAIGVLKRARLKEDRLLHFMQAAKPFKICVCMDFRASLSLLLPEKLISNDVDTFPTGDVSPRASRNAVIV